MDITTIVIGVVVVLCVATGWVVMRKDKADAAPVSKNIALRDSAAIALTHYWSHHHEDWSLALFRDGSGVVRLVACGVPDGTFFDARGYSHKEQIAGRLGIEVTAEHCDEAEVQSLLGSNNAVLEAADDLRHYAGRKAS